MLKRRLHKVYLFVFGQISKRWMHFSYNCLMPADMGKVAEHQASEHSDCPLPKSIGPFKRFQYLLGITLW